MKKQLSIVLLVFLTACQGFAQENLCELGANFNHNPEIIEIDLLERAGVRWVRATPRFYEYLEQGDSFSPMQDPGLMKTVEVANAGYRVAFGFRFDFKQNNERIPAPGSAREREMFEVVREVLAYVGPHLDMFKLGNEPNLETLEADLEFQETHGGIPLVVFTERLLDEVVDPYYNLRPSLRRPDVYAGSLPALFDSRWRNNPGALGLIQLAQDDDRIAGFDLHLHITSFSEVDDAFQITRAIMPDKPIIVTEFSLHRLYRSRINERLGINAAGEAFAAQYGHDPDWESYRWYTHVNSNRVEPQEIADFFATRDWYIPNYLDVYRQKFDENNVVLATYPILQQSAPLVLNSDSPLWFLNPVYMQVSLVTDENGELGANPLCHDDYLEWASFRPVVANLESGGQASVPAFEVFPNPTSGYLFIDTPAQEHFLLTITDMAGKESLRYERLQTHDRINVSSLQRGLYLLSIRFASGQVANQRLVIE